MPYYIRRLPTQSKGTMVDPKSLPGNLAFFNPSRAGDITYIRVTEHEASGVTQRNKIFLFDNEKKEQHMIPSPWDQLVKTGNMFQGIEDLRITWFEDRLWFAGTTTHASQEMTNELIVGHFNKRLTEVEFLSTVDIGHLPVKNVCPFVWKGKLCLWDTFKRRIYEIYKEEQHPKKLFAKTIQTFEFGPGLPTTELRGSTSPIHLHGNTWGCVVHDIIFNDTPMVTFRLSYIHHWLEFDIERGQITFISQPFFIAHWGIEYVSGIYQDPKDREKITLYFGVEDRQALECTTRVHELRFGKALR
jgi:hypothetical protein